MKAISILGSTGSIGTNTLRVLASFPKDFRLVGLSAGRNVLLLAEQVEQHQPEIVSTADEQSSADLRQILQKRNYPAARTCFVFGTEGNTEVACHPQTAMVVSAITGAAGLVPTYQALCLGKSIALANKEAMVMAGKAMTVKAAEKGVSIIPVDSEHNAIHQCLRSGRPEEVRRLILTASGGPFRDTPKEKFASITPAQALNHPTWRMGKKITIDSATLMNKGLEVIEASWFFNVPPEKVEVVVHPQSVVHSMVEYRDGSIVAQMGLTDMRIPIQYALTYPDRWQTVLPSLQLHKLDKLEFLQPDREKFKCLDLAYTALRSGGTAPAVLNAANEIAVEAFLGGGIGFNHIPEIIEKVLGVHAVSNGADLDAILKADSWARTAAAELVKEQSKKTDKI
jgi:1-deoxy-D-xylulose-5-phosphate reductoisomerase